MTILIADDEKDIRNLIKINLEEGGYTTVTAQDGKEAWEILTTKEVHLAILDVMMPVMDGFNLLRKIREHSTVPVIFLTARAEIWIKCLARIARMTILSNLFHFRANGLCGRTTGDGIMVSSPKENTNTQITYGNLSINKEICCVFKMENLLNLARRNTSCFCISWSTQKGLQDGSFMTLYGMKSIIYDNTVMVHISRIRNQIEDNPQSPQYLKPFAVSVTSSIILVKCHEKKNINQFLINLL